MRDFQSLLNVRSLEPSLEITFQTRQRVTPAPLTIPDTTSTPVLIYAVLLIMRRFGEFVAFMLAHTSLPV